MYKDSRTDNWGGYHDYNRDPNQYHFPRSTREIGWGFYRNISEHIDYEKTYPVSTFVFIVAGILLLAALIPDLRTLIYMVSHLIVDWWSTFDTLWVR